MGFLLKKNQTVLLYTEKDVSLRMMVHKKTLSLSYILFFSAHFLHAQNSILDRRISIQTDKLYLPLVLEKISEKGSFYFSYNPSIVKPDSIVSIKETEKTIRYILDKLFNSSLRYKQTGEHLILKNKRTGQNKITVEKISPFLIEGYLINKQTGEKIQYASIYEKDNFSSVISDITGFYSIKTILPVTTLFACKENFLDTVIVIKSDTAQRLNFYLTPVVEEKQKDTSISIAKVEKLGFVDWLTNAKQKIQSANIKFLANRKIQVSLLPFIGTNLVQNGQIASDWSLNFAGGYSGAINKAELGLGFNIVRKNVQYFQLAGICNIVGGNVRAFQTGGLFNLNLNNTSGASIAGITNISMSDLKGVQIGGALNYVGSKTRGVQLSPLFNISNNLSGSQISGLVNYCDTATGFQLSMIGNVAAKQIKGLQISGLFNKTEKINGVQFSLLSNKAENVKGLQLSGFINTAKTVRGMQIGLLNTCDSMTGVPIGLINIVGNGYHIIELSSNEVNYVNFSLKTGIHKLYSILHIGSNGLENDKVFSFGYGLGSFLVRKKVVGLFTEIQADYVNIGDLTKKNILTKLNIGTTFNLSKKFAFFISPSFNYYYHKQQVPMDGFNYNIPTNLPQRFIRVKSSSATIWVGCNIGIRFS